MAAVGRSGKSLVWELEDETFLLAHLRMTGAFLLDPEVEPAHARVRIELDDGHRLVYVDPRRFGTGQVVHGADARDEYLHARLGVEPLTPEFTADYLRAITRGRTAPIKSFILDQRRIAGVGNIYADESLFRARIHPLRPAGSLRGGQFEALRQAIDDFTAGRDRVPGGDDRRLSPSRRRLWFRAGAVPRLRTAGEPCVRCGTTIRKLVVGGRGTYVCEHDQPRPRIRRVR